MNKKLLAYSLLIAMLTESCATQNPNHVKYVEVDGKRFAVNSNGEVEMSSAEYRQYIHSKSVTLTEEEFLLLQSDQDAFYGIIGAGGSTGVTLLLSRGSLRDGLTNAVRNLVPAEIRWLAPHDFHLSEPFAIVADDIDLAVGEALLNFPLKYSVEESNGLTIITVRPAHES